jgi:hypothetical protein
MSGKDIRFFVFGRYAVKAKTVNIFDAMLAVPG